MIKSLFISIWAIVVTVGVVFLPSLFASDDADDRAVATTMIDHRSDTMSAALFDEGSVVGHFTTRVRYQLPKGAIDPEVVPVNQIILDGLFELVHKADPKKLAKLKEPQLTAMADQLALALNNRSTPFPISNVRFDSARLMLKINPQ